MNKYLQGRMNAIKSQLQQLNLRKMGKHHFNMVLISKLTDELKAMKITSIDKVNDTAIMVRLDNNEVASFHKFGGTIYSTISEGLDKHIFLEFKKDIEKFEWDVEKLKKEWIAK